MELRDITLSDVIVAVHFKTNEKSWTANARAHHILAYQISGDFPHDFGGRTLTAKTDTILFFNKSDINSGVHIDIKKHIPVEAGLGGGSADAAAVLTGLNELFDEPFLTSELLKLASTLGADVPFCMQKGCAYAGGIGDLLDAIPSMPDCHIVIARGGEGFSTPLAYKLLDDKYDNFSAQKYHKRDAAKIKLAIEQKDLHIRMHPSMLLHHIRDRV